jgi:putative Holliday junction resolvase
VPGNQQASILAIDFGEKRVGLALAHEISAIASPLETIINGDDLFDKLSEIVGRENVVSLVVGYPRGLSGQTTNQTLAVDGFIGQLQDMFDLPITRQDEALTSEKAKAELEIRKKPYTKAEIDSLAATYILEDWLSEHESIV